MSISLKIFYIFLIKYTRKETLEFEAHLLILFELLLNIYTDISYISDQNLLIQAEKILKVLLKIKEKFSRLLDETESDPIDKNFFKNFDTLLNFLNPVNLMNQDTKAIMSFLNECCFNNIQKYNLNEKPMNEESIRDQTFKDYVKEMKLKILNYSNRDVDFLDSVKNQKSLINELFVAVKLINLSVLIIYYILIYLEFIRLFTIFHLKNPIFPNFTPKFDYFFLLYSY